MSETKQPVEVGDVIQIRYDAEVRPVLKYALGYVDEIKSWGVVAAVKALASPHVVRLRECDMALVRLKWSDFVKLGGRIKFPLDEPYTLEKMVGDD